MCSIHRDQSTWLHPIAPQLLYVNTGKLVEEELTKQELQMLFPVALFFRVTFNVEVVVPQL